MFKLNSQLEQDTISIGEFPLSNVLLMNDVRYPWIILVPRVENITEIFELTDKQQQQLMYESNLVAKRLKALVQADKMNVAALGNVVSQLHIHHVARFRADEAWPAPVWGKGHAIHYSQTEQHAVIKQITTLFSDELNSGDKIIL
ncbi:MAG: HIT domain-containing protein [Gammaproteobacteria bacterium]|nr:HIT domain-containing protein [Gammaproteobacteria bacterium]